MKSFDKVIAAVLALMLLMIGAVNIIILGQERKKGDIVRVETERVKYELTSGNTPNAKDYEHIVGIYKNDGIDDFYESRYSYVICETDDGLYRIDYENANDTDTLKRTLIIVNTAMGVFSLIVVIVLVYIRRKVIRPFNELSEMPIELAKGNLTKPLKESRSRFFGRFIWGTDMLREKMEKQRERELAAARDKQTLILSLSHDIKTPLSAIKLYSKALQRGLYGDEEKLSQVYTGLSERADEIEGYLTRLSAAAREDFLGLEVENGEAYLSEIITSIKRLYTDKLSVTGTEFVIGEHGDCLLKCDTERAIEVMQNLMENAIKYGDGRRIAITFSDEEDCRLVTVTNTGCTLVEDEAMHIFESFYRGSNVGSKPGSGLGLYIARQLMLKMGGDIFADIKNDEMSITLVFARA